MEIRIGENIKRRRGEKGVTQEQLAEILHVSAVAVSKWERGETMPDISLLPQLALNKKSKELWFCTDGSVEEKAEQAAAFCAALQQLQPFFPDGSLPGLISYFAEDFASKLQYLANADEKTIEKIQPYIGVK